MANWIQRTIARALLGSEQRFVAGSETWIPIPAVSGVIVNEDTALTLVAFFAAVNVLSTNVALYDFNVVKFGDDGSRTIDRGHRCQELIHFAPNREITAFNFRQAMMGHICLRGNAFAEIERDPRTDAPVALHLLDPCRVDPHRDAETHELYYKVGENKIVLPEDMLHVAGLGYDGIVGYSPVRYAREAIGLGIAGEKFGASFFGNGCVPKGFLKLPDEMTKPARQELREELQRVHGGPYNANKPGILPPGVDWVQTTLPPEEAQFLLTQKWSVEQIARLFNLPPHKLQALDNAHFNNVNELNIEFYETSILPWLVKFEHEFRRKLFAPEERKQWSVEHDMRTLLRANLSARADYFTKLMGVGVYSINEVRKLEYMNPIPNGDQHRVPLNMEDVGSPTPSQGAAA